MMTLPELPYNYDALAPVIGEDIMRLHHTKHHQGYVDKMNNFIVQFSELQSRDIVDILTHINDVPEEARVGVRNQGGGHYNHSLFWTIMSPNGGGQPSGELAEAIAQKYGSFEMFVEQFNQKALGLFGSGWVWLTADLETVAMPNQDNPLMEGGREPLMGLDVWEHAYYLDYKNKRDDYIREWWKVVDWTAVEQRYGNR